MKTLQKGVMQVTRDPRTLTDARLQRHLELMLQLPDTQLVGHPHQCQKEQPHREPGTNSSGNTRERRRNPASAALSFQTPSLFDAITRKEYFPGGKSV